MDARDDQLSPAGSALGIDIGRVLIATGAQLGPDTSFLGADIEAAIHTPPYPGMFEVVPALVKAFHRRVVLVSKASSATEEKTRRWLDHHQFFERTNIPRNNLVFCSSRMAKASICKELGITHFIDDRRDVLEFMREFVAHRYLFGPQTSAAKAEPGLEHVPTWSDVSRSILESGTICHQVLPSRQDKFWATLRYPTWVYEIPREVMQMELESVPGAKESTVFMLISLYLTNSHTLTEESRSRYRYLLPEDPAFDDVESLARARPIFSGEDGDSEGSEQSRS
ncbi:hypothetical protein [Hydrocarboniphaga effusa]|uniref:hypothetical protein n=1 Tax=Hydrocarboniphaga effusa TaxID=243629 RepID=UPI003BABBA50